MSASLMRHQQFEKRRPIRLIAGILFFVLYGLYLIWRVTIFNADSVILSSLFYAMDFIGFFLGGLLMITAYTGRPDYPEEPTPEGLDVDVFIPTYKEPASIIQKTIEAAVALDYPHKTVVLDDANRPEIKKIAESLGAIYRARGKNIKAKAGNLNFGLTQSSSDFVVVFDADHIPQREALNKLLAFMGDRRVGMVQTPQEYYNIDALQYIDWNKNRTLWHEQSFFYNTIQICNNKYNSLSCVGTGVVYRRKALDEIGGIPDETITEDLHTSLRLQKAGWVTKYINEAVAYGLAAADITEFYTTRKRWFHGNVDAICRENVLFCKELTWRQKVAYLRMGLVCLEGFQQLLMGVIPPIALIFGLQPFEITAFNVLIVMVFPLISHVLLQEFSGGRFWPNTLLSKLLFPIHIVSCAAAFGKEMLWKSSRKIMKARINYKLLAPQITMGIINLAAIFYSIWRLYPDFKRGPLLESFISFLTGDNMRTAFSEINFFEVLGKGYTLDLAIIAGFWALFNVLSIALLVYKSQKKARKSDVDYLFHVEFPFEGLLYGSDKIYAVTKRCASNFLEFSLVGNSSEMSPLPDTFDITLYTPSGNFPIILSKVRKRKKGKYKAAIQWHHGQDKKHFEDSLYSVGWHRRLYHYEGCYKTPLESLMTFLRLEREKRLQTVKPLLLSTKDVSKMSLRFAALKKTAKGSSTYTLMSFMSLNIGDKIEFEEFSKRGIKRRNAHIIKELSKKENLFIEKNLDGTIVRKYTVDIT